MTKAPGTEAVLEVWDDFICADNLLSTTDELLEYLALTTKGRIQTVNLQHIYVAASSSLDLSDLRNADKVTADGWPLKWYTRMNHKKETARVTGRQALDLVLAGETTHLRLATVGGSVDAGDHLQRVVTDSGKQLVYRNEGVIPESDYPKILDELSHASPDLILTALGSPRGERLGRMIAERDDIRAVVIGIGGAIEMWHGSTPGAPDWAQRAGLEWLYRLVREPRRLFRRYVLECAPLMLVVLKRVGLERSRRP